MIMARGPIPYKQNPARDPSAHIPPKCSLPNFHTTGVRNPQEYAAKQTYVHMKEEDTKDVELLVTDTVGTPKCTRKMSPAFGRLINYIHTTLLGTHVLGHTCRRSMQTRSNFTRIHSPFYSDFFVQ